MTQEEFEHLQRIHEAHQKLSEDVRTATRFAQLTQQMIDNRKRQKYAVIVAVDVNGGFSADGEIPWYYKEDFAWFKEKTTGHICVMGRKTYDDINERLGDEGAESVLPNRRCFVVTSSPLPRDNATVVKSITEVDQYLSQQDIDNDRIVFFIGGGGIYSEGISKSDTAYITVVNKDIENVDLFFPVKYLQDHFNPITNDTSVHLELAFTIWSRKHTS